MRAKIICIDTFRQQLQQECVDRLECEPGAEDGAGGLQSKKMCTGQTLVEGARRVAARLRQMIATCDFWGNVKYAIRMVSKRWVGSELRVAMDLYLLSRDLSNNNLSDTERVAQYARRYGILFRSRISLGELRVRGDRGSESDFLLRGTRRDLYFQYLPVMAVLQAVFVIGGQIESRTNLEIYRDGDGRRPLSFTVVTGRLRQLEHPDLSIPAALHTYAAQTKDLITHTQSVSFAAGDAQAACKVLGIKELSVFQ